MRFYFVYYKTNYYNRHEERVKISQFTSVFLFIPLHPQFVRLYIYIYIYIYIYMYIPSKYYDRQKTTRECGIF